MSSGNTIHVNVFLIRHGEREDEAISKKYKRKIKPTCKKDAIDPQLTAIGFGQAKSAFQNIARQLSEIKVNELQDDEINKKKKKVFVFSSPMRRTIGTALMSCYIENDDIELGLPCDIDANRQSNEQHQLSPTKYNAVKQRENDDSCEKNRSNDTYLPSATNIIVMDGLCDCAAAVQKSGGATSAVAKGYIDCSANVNRKFDEDSFYSGLHHMEHLCKNHVAHQSQTQKLTRKIRFWREKSYRYDNDEIAETSFEPMTHNFQIGNIMNYTETYDMKHDRDVTPPRQTSRTDNFLDSYLNSAPTRVLRTQYENTFLGAINRAAYLTARAGSDTCLIVTHREGLRFLATEVCGFKYPSPNASSVADYRTYSKLLRTPYCCIGSYKAKVKFNRPNVSNRQHMYSVKWIFQGIQPYEYFRLKTSLELTLPTENKSTPFDIQISATPNNETKKLCTVCSVYSSGEGVRRYLPKSMVISTFVSNNYSRNSYCLLHKLQIVDGSRALSDFFAFLHKKMLCASGTLTYFADEEDIEVSHSATFFIVARDQNILPCPPTYLYIQLDESMKQI